MGAFEEALVHKITFQLWRADRLIRHETGLVHDRIVNPDGIFDQEVDKETVQDVITKSQKQLESELRAAEELVARYEALRTEATDILFAPDEVRKILEGVLSQLEACKYERAVE